jgi:hypothetical protein
MQPISEQLVFPGVYIHQGQHFVCQEAETVPSL